VGRAQPTDPVLEGLHEMAEHVAVLLAAAEQRLGRDHGTIPEGALRRLLRGGPATAHELGVRPDVAYRCVVASDGPPLGCPVEAAIGGHRAALTLHPPEPDGTRVVVVAPPGTLAEAASRYPACAAALSVAPGPGVHDVLDLAPVLAFAGQPMLGDLLAAHLLAGLDPHDEFHRELATTALTFLDHGRRVDRTAAALFLHPNTVRYRLRRLHDLLGPVLEPRERMPMPAALRLWWALRHWLDLERAPGPTVRSHGAHEARRDRA
jgi:hypothetical protein